MAVRFCFNNQFTNLTYRVSAQEHTDDTLVEEFAMYHRKWLPSEKAVVSDVVTCSLYGVFFLYLLTNLKIDRGVKLLSYFNNISGNLKIIF